MVQKKVQKNKNASWLYEHGFPKKVLFSLKHTYKECFFVPLLPLPNLFRNNIRGLTSGSSLFLTH
jgi:hypothetical protein